MEPRDRARDLPLGLRSDLLVKNGSRWRDMGERKSLNCGFPVLVAWSCAVILARRVAGGVCAHGEDDLGSDGGADRALASADSRDIETSGVLGDRPAKSGFRNRLVVRDWRVFGWHANSLIGTTQLL